ncbi:MAG TPA: hypothetical protein VML01_03695 [Bryobacterales bacterium]|nr:hypothetical protein [Bryobacterales bacterium]
MARTRRKQSSYAYDYQTQIMQEHATVRLHIVTTSPGASETQVLSFAAEFDPNWTPITELWVLKGL